jgi:putative transposase
VDTTLPAERVIRALEEAVDFRGSASRQIRVDNWPEFISAKLTGWCERRGI